MLRGSSLLVAWYVYVSGMELLCIIGNDFVLCSLGLEMVGASMVCCDFEYLGAVYLVKNSMRPYLELVCWYVTRRMLKIFNESVNFPHKFCTPFLLFASPHGTGDENNGGENLRVYCTVLELLLIQLFPHKAEKMKFVSGLINT